MCRCFSDPVLWYTVSLLDGVGVVKKNHEDFCVGGPDYYGFVSMQRLRHDGDTSRTTPFSWLL